MTNPMTAYYRATPTGYIQETKRSDPHCLGKTPNSPEEPDFNGPLVRLLQENNELRTIRLRTVMNFVPLQETTQ